MSDGILSRQIDLWTMIGCETELSKILPAVVSFMEAELPELAAAVFLCDARSGQLRLICASALPDEWVSRLAERPYTASAEPAMRAVANNEEVFVHDLAATAPASEETNDRGLAEIRRAWALPLREYSGSVLGALAVYGRKPGLPGMAERKALEAAAQIVAAALMAHRRKEFEIAHIEQLRRIYDNVNDVLFSVAIAPDGEYYFESANSRFFEATGADLGSGRGKTRFAGDPRAFLRRGDATLRACDSGAPNGSLGRDDSVPHGIEDGGSVRFAGARLGRPVHQAHRVRA